jgi:glucose-6-phosphate isomerase
MAIFDQENSVSNLKVPQIHLPPRLVPNVAWEHHHRATTRLVHDRFNRPKPEDDKVDQETQKRQSLLVSNTPEWKRLQEHKLKIDETHLRDLLKDQKRSDAMFAEHDGVYLDYSRQRANLETLKLLQDLAKRQKLPEQIKAMLSGEKINFTEDRAVLHTALRADRSEEIYVDGENVVEEVHQVLDQIKEFTEGVRSGSIRGYTGKRLRNIISVGIGGSYLGPEFLHEVLKTEPEGINSALGYSLRFLANVDPVDVERTCADLDPEETLIVIVSKTFTTAETMLNARTVRQWLWDFMGNDKEVVRKHMVACASVSSTELVQEFGIDTDKYFFRFWDWVGGRYSVCSAAGAVPITLMYGFDLFEKFLKVRKRLFACWRLRYYYQEIKLIMCHISSRNMQGAQSIDRHFASAPMDKNIPVLMGLLGIWNHSFLGYQTRTTLPYAEALLKLPSHIQQLDMESNGKVMTKHGIEVNYPVGEIDFGEPGTNGQHSFFQLLHMGQTVPCDFIGFCQSQHDLCLDGEPLSSHDELMSNFFAQPDALANGKTAEEVRAEGVAEDLIPHRTFKGNRPSMSLLLPKLTAHATGQLLALYEHRTAVQGFIWDINSFDQWGVELGKKLAIDVKDHLLQARQSEDHVIEASNPASSRILNFYVDKSRDDHTWEDATTVNPLTRTRVTRKTHEDHARAPPPVQHDLGGNNGRL